MKTEVDDWLTELPPLDGDEDEPDSSDEVSDDPLPEPEDASSLDDAAAEDLDVDIGVDIPDDEQSQTKSKPSGAAQGLRSAEADDESWQADVGEPELDLVDDEPMVEADGEPPAEADGDFGDHEDLPASEDDDGEEGTTDPIEHSLDEELPAIDADDEGDFEDARLLETGEVAQDPETLRWADAAWSECSSLHRSFPWAEPENDPLVALASTAVPDLIVAIARSGILWVSSDGGRTATRASGSFEHLVPDDPDGEPLLIALVPSPGGKPVLFIANSAGQLAASHDLGQTFRPCATLGRPIVALTTREDGSLVVLARKDSVMELLHSTDGTTWFTQVISGDVAVLAAAKPRTSWIACRGAQVVVGDHMGALHSRDGRHFARIPGTTGATAGVFAGTDSRAPLVLSGFFGDDDEVHLVRIGHGTLPEIVAQVEPATVSDAMNGGSAVLGLTWLEGAGAVRVLLSGGVMVWSPQAVGAPVGSAK